MPESAISWFEDMVEHCYESATKAKESGGKVVGIMCEYTPRELIIAAGALPVCLCGGSAKMIPAAEAHLPANLCPLIKSTFGYSVNQANPFLEMADLLVAETTCDGKKKMYELLAERHPMYVLELPQKPEDPDARAHWMSELRKLRGELERRLGAEITDARLRDAIRAMNRERSLRRGLAEMMRDDTPPLSGRELLELKSLISCLPKDLAAYERALATLPRRAAAKRPPQGSVRVLLTGVPTPHGAERIVELIENHGGLVVCQENCTGIKPIADDIPEDSGDPIEALADAYFHLPCSIMTPNERRRDKLRRFAHDFRAECIVELIWQSCLTYDVESAYTRRLTEQELGLPYLRVETDYSPSDDARLAMRLEALFETVRGARR
ncbi:MAG: double-cubane-cluster-containing anaerobic reductase [Kiritimatiellae bacterium]|nr:double-cubane-cluster-containing anaerobic reductase [Kiritimatiellia bacterium]